MAQRQRCRRRTPSKPTPTKEQVIGELAELADNPVPAAVAILARHLKCQNSQQLSAVLESAVRSNTAYYRSDGERNMPVPNPLLAPMV